MHWPILVTSCVKSKLRVKVLCEKHMYGPILVTSCVKFKLHVKVLYGKHRHGPILVTFCAKSKRRRVKMVGTTGTVSAIAVKATRTVDMNSYNH